MLTDEQLNAMVGAPLLVEEYKQLKVAYEKSESIRAEAVDMAKMLMDKNQEKRKLIRDAIYVLMSGITAYDTVTRLMSRARELGAIQ